MKKMFILFIFIFFALFVELDYGYSLFFRTDPNLKEIEVTSIDYQKLEEENEELKKLVNIWSPSSEKQTSKVVLHNPYQFFDQITILKGKEEGMQVNDFVWNEDGYIGKIIEVRNHSSIVELFTSKSTNLPVKVQNSYGILEREGNNLVVKNITSKEKIEEGSIIYTSVYSEIGVSIPVAKVEKVEESTIEQVLQITPLISIDSLNYVIVERAKTYD